MRFVLVPTLTRLRAVYAVPRGPLRFEAYIAATVGGATRTADVALPPLVAANPMARDHATACLDTWLALDAEEVTAVALAEAEIRPTGRATDVTVRVGLTLLDDVGGGWTNRVISDAGRFAVGRTLTQTGWLSVPLWTGEVPDTASLRRTVLASAFRAMWASEHGDPVTLRDHLTQEGQALAFAGQRPRLDPHELAYTRAVLAPLLDSAHQPTTYAALYGDDGARAWGYPPLGLARHAGFELALADALNSP
ncbi:hypothetical protein [Deinococcus yunweiensis]|uniref:hypothetical protein n=1 Tax=Deinococcus yunweiensis TaxID=367282 RepID=UPI00398ECE2B